MQESQNKIYHRTQTAIYPASRMRPQFRSVVEVTLKAYQHFTTNGHTRPMLAQTEPRYVSPLGPHSSRLMPKESFTTLDASIRSPLVLWRLREKIIYAFLASLLCGELLRLLWEGLMPRPEHENLVGYKGQATRGQSKVSFPCDLFDSLAHCLVLVYMDSCYGKPCIIVQSNSFLSFAWKSPLTIG